MILQEIICIMVPNKYWDNNNIHLSTFYGNFVVNDRGQIVLQVFTHYKCTINVRFFVQVMCLESLSCWKIQPCFNFNVLTDGGGFFVKNLSIHNPIHPFLNMDQSSYTLFL